MADKRSQAPGGDADPLPNNFSGKTPLAKSNAPKIDGAEAMGNATGPALTEKRGQQGRG